MRLIFLNHEQLMALSVNTVHSAWQIHQWINGESTSLPIKRPTEQTVHLPLQPSNVKTGESAYTPTRFNKSKQIDWPSKSLPEQVTQSFSLWIVSVLIRFSAGRYSLTRTRQIYEDPPSPELTRVWPFLWACTARAPFEFGFLSVFLHVVGKMGCLYMLWW